jgi:hypothetical protein
VLGACVCVRQAFPADIMTDEEWHTLKGLPGSTTRDDQRTSLLPFLDLLLPPLWVTLFNIRVTGYDGTHFNSKTRDEWGKCIA